MATLVLVHGAWHGGWCWNSVAEILRRDGHSVHAPTLLGMGPFRATRPNAGAESSRRPGLHDHVNQVVDLLQASDLHDVVLVGHSYGSMVITGAAQVAGERLGRLVYLDAFVPRPGQSFFDLVPDELRLNLLSTSDSGWVRPRPPSLFGITDPDLAAWTEARLTAQPIETFEQALPETSVPPLERRYIRCAGTPDRPNRPNPVADQLRNDPGWSYAEVPCGHDAMLLRPHALVEALGL
ncbi:alpha/beta fold hydrolase [Nocardioides soli]|uniref:Pimeloyl-ACP methyl ester carboxylesterase n=1 Tax=Nocardioides soli TaxID=1036020 RepID=A0A7W4W232_9ACTN|nr:alpha/beta hydrolase [Nocardioides soli]MBB3045524.1 pimeloyl-ACP methyl ester carboxylesterase [Nocardioides soli]